MLTFLWVSQLFPLFPSRLLRVPTFGGCPETGAETGVPRLMGVPKRKLRRLGSCFWADHAARSPVVAVNSDGEWEEE